MTVPVIHAVGLVHVADGRLLVVRPVDKGAFYLPGGKPEAGETDEQAVRREVFEELGVGVTALTPFGRYVAPAYGEGPDAIVDLMCYGGELVGEPQPAAEVAELAHVTVGEYAAHTETAPAIHRLLDDLYAAGLVSA
jgi:8-oxo-dGTP pyrophosphatase MutT (NUDIX family)